MSDAMTIAAAAMRSAENQVSATAARIVRMTATRPSAPVAAAGGGQSSSDPGIQLELPTASLVEELVNLKQAELGFRAGIAISRAADCMTRHTLDILT